MRHDHGPSGAAAARFAILRAVFPLLAVLVGTRRQFPGRHDVPFPPARPARDHLARPFLRHQRLVAQRRPEELAGGVGGGQEGEVLEGGRVLEEAGVTRVPKVAQVLQVAVGDDLVSLESVGGEREEVVVGLREVEDLLEERRLFEQALLRERCEWHSVQQMREDACRPPPIPSNDDR